MDFEKFGNLTEAAVWLAVSIVFAIKAKKAKGPLQLAFAILAIAFIAFCASDLIESETGAWWRPLWLLALKGLCVAAIVVGFGIYYKVTRRSRGEAAKNLPQPKASGP